MSVFKKDISRREFVKKGLVTGGVLAGSSLLLAGCPPPQVEPVPPVKKLRAAFSNAGLAATWCAQGKDTVMTWAERLGVDVTWYDGALSLDVQVAAAEDMALKDWDFVAIQPLAIGLLTKPVRAMLDRGIPVIGMDTMIAEPGELPLTSFIAPDNVWGAEGVTEILMRKIGGEGNVVMTQGMLGHTGAQGRAQGFRNVLKKYPNVKLIDETPADWDVMRVTDIWEDLLVRFDRIDAAFFHNDDMAMAAHRVIEAAGRKLPIAGIDGMPPALKAVEDGIMLATYRNSAPRIHWGALMIGYYAATEKDVEIPPFILADGPIITYELDQRQEIPWLNISYGKSIAPGLIWQQDRHMA